MAQLHWNFLHPKMTIEHLGYIPYFLDTNDPRPAKEQINERYQFGGWQPFGQGQWNIRPDGTLTYPNDPPLAPLARAKLRDETIYFYQHSWVCILQPDGSFEVCRLD